MKTTILTLTLALLLNGCGTQTDTTATNYNDSNIIDTIETETGNNLSKECKESMTDTPTETETIQVLWNDSEDNVINITYCKGEK